MSLALYAAVATWLKRNMQKVQKHCYCWKFGENEIAMLYGRALILLAIIHCCAPWECQEVGLSEHTLGMQ